jgi:glyoxylase-like metal-dependent hydrolase (beta-lactamase superfamily II)
MAVQFAVLASGSRGNSTLVRGRGAGLLIDVGIGPKIMGERLASVGSSWSRIATVVLTHTHADHVDTATFGELALQIVESLEHATEPLLAGGQVVRDLIQVLRHNHIYVSNGAPVGEFPTFSPGFNRRARSACGAAPWPGRYR